MKEDRLRELAAAATPGPWQFEYAGQFGKMGEVELYGNAQLPDEGDLIAVFSRDDNEQGAEPNAAYVAAVSPDVVLALLDERDAQQAEIAVLKRKLEMCDLAYRTYRSLAGGDQ